MADATEWEYTVQLYDDVRLYRIEGEYVERRDIAWSLSRRCQSSSGRPSRQNIVVSSEVFDDDDDAKRDALEKLSILRCPFDRPVDRAIKWILSDA